VYLLTTILQQALPCLMQLCGVTSSFH